LSDTATDKATADAWDEGGNNRALLQAAGGALIGGLGGGSVLTAAGSAAGAGFASKAAKGLTDIANGVDSATGSQLIGNLAANVAADLGGALVGGTAGAASASKVHLYNQSIDDEAQLTGDNGNSSNPFSQSPGTLILKGIANGLGAVFGVFGGEPPTAGSQAVLVNPAGPSTTTTPSTAYAQDNATLASGGNNSRLPIPDTVTADNGLQVESNPKHTAGMPGNNPNAGTEPTNSLDLFNSSIPGGDGVRYAIDSNGNINRFYSDGNGVYHWSGSTGDSSAPLNVSKIPINVKRTLGFTGR